MAKRKYRIFIVDDSTLFLKVLNSALSVNDDYDIKLITTGRECVELLREKPDIITLDYTLPDMNGKEVLERINALSPDTHVIVVSGQSDITTAIDLLKKGAYDYIVKGVDTREKIEISIRKIIETLKLKAENKILKEAIKTEYNFRSLIKGSSKVMENVFIMMGKAAQTNISVSVFGETGSGKELVAKGLLLRAEL